VPVFADHRGDFKPGGRLWSAWFLVADYLPGELKHAVDRQVRVQWSELLPFAEADPS
jgi:hypothetical protein